MRYFIFVLLLSLRISHYAPNNFSSFDLINDRDNTPTSLFLTQPITSLNNPNQNKYNQFQEEERRINPFEDQFHSYHPNHSLGSEFRSSFKDEPQDVKWQRKDTNVSKFNDKTAFFLFAIIIGVVFFYLNSQ